MQNVEQTIVSQYGNSPTLLQLIQNMNGYLDPSADIDAFYNAIWNINTANDFGLDIWGRIVGVSRFIKITNTPDNFGFSEAGAGAEPFGQGTFWTGSPSSSMYELSTDAFRTLILVKAIANISNSTARSYNQLLQNMFSGRGRCYVQDTGGMSMTYVFEFDLLPYEVSIISNSGAFPRPAAVRASAISIQPNATFGFQEAGIYQTFGHGTFFSPSQVINVA